ncbi:MAG: phytanoyl-CoA dioxygenase family protein [Planctomycetota bacterium]|jgi:ectoine hydroxylase-related dioxygenase (phytanoyl-CoA dioxygenase family)
MSDYEYEKYLSDIDNLKSTLEKYGVAIIPSILDEQECKNIVSGIWDFLEYISKPWDTPLNRNNQESWKSFYELYPLHSMLLKNWNIGHAQVSWDVRQNPKILKVFSHLYNTTPENLLTSFDGFSFHIPPEITNRGWFRNKLWLHCDQSFTDNQFKCIQSWVTGLDINENDGTLAILEKSHHFHKDFGRDFEIKDRSNWYKLDSVEVDYFINNECSLKKIKCPKGSLVLWDSRTIHCGIEPNKSRSIPNFRAIIYLCYLPRNLASEKDIQKKQKAFEELRTTSHWPCKIKLNPKDPRTYGNSLNKYAIINHPSLLEIGYKLAGF